MPTSRRRFMQSIAFGGAALGLGMAAAGQSGGRRWGWNKPGAEIPGLAGDTIDVEPAPKSLKILFLGGTGFLGPHTVEYLEARGHEITLFTRGRTRSELFDHLEKLTGDRDPQVNEGLTALEGDRRWDAVIDTSGHIPRLMTASCELLKDRIGQYLFVSSMCAHADWTSVVGATEEQPLATLDDPTTEDLRAHYCELKAYCERAAGDVLRDKLTVIRPGLIVGPLDFSDRFTYWPVRVDRGGEVLAPNSPDDPTQFIDARDLARFMVHALEQNILGEYNCTGRTLNMGELLYGCKAVTGGDAHFTWADAEWLEEQGVQGWLHMPAWVNPVGEGAGACQWNVDKAFNAGLTTRPLAQTVRDTLDWWVTQPDERRSQMRAGLPPEREAEVLKAWHEQQGS